ncbi:PIN domain-containing protein [Duganella sp. FT134W]|uniref:Ribonuclease VapC n=1 Tax=Duganella margarita TaxID=2692170 RepID=A0A7X4KJ97_9BURK|nr:type II toxin-antitoxin system VapC family toxin [Duganella margarita]MYM74378.1 PIN domain-containing protein [Duganella margarita]
MAEGFVLDASVTIRWALHDGTVADRTYADKVLDSFVNGTAMVPALWATEVVHVLRCAEQAGQLGEAAVAAFLYQLGQLPISSDSAAPIGLQLAVAAVSREFRLSGYDAQYLELARRLGLPLATLDKDLRRAAKKAGVSIYL